MSMERRIGVLLPSSNRVIEPEFYRTVPPGITIHSMRLFLTEVKYNAWMVMNQEIKKGRENDDETIVVVSQGMIAGDIALVNFVYEKAMMRRKKTSSTLP